MHIFIEFKVQAVIAISAPNPPILVDLIHSIMVFIVGLMSLPICRARKTSLSTFSSLSLQAPYSLYFTTIWFSSSKCFWNTGLNSTILFNPGTSECGTAIVITGRHFSKSSSALLLCLLFWNKIPFEVKGTSSRDRILTMGFS